MVSVFAELMDRRWMHEGGHGHWLWLLGLVVVTSLIGLIVWLFVRASRSTATAPRSRAPEPRASAEEVLADRLARGEIDPDEYRQRLNALRGN
jgi:putative membrane protein